MVAWLHRGDARSHLSNDSGALVTQDGGKDPFAVKTIQSVGVGVADTGRLDFDQDFSGFRAIKIKLDDLKRLFCFERDSGAGFHRGFDFRISRHSSRSQHTSLRVLYSFVRDHARIFGSYFSVKKLLRASGVTPSPRSIASSAHRH